LEIECPSYLQRIGQVKPGISFVKPKRFDGSDYRTTPWTVITSIVIDPNDNNIFYLSDYRMGVYVSINGGKSWMPINKGLNFKAATSLSISGDGSILYASTAGGGVYWLNLR